MTRRNQRRRSHTRRGRYKATRSKDPGEFNLPVEEDDDFVPKSLQRMMKLSSDIGDGKKKRNSKRQSTQTADMDKKPDKSYPISKRYVGESMKSFSNRLDKNTREEILREEKFKTAKHRKAKEFFAKKKAKKQSLDKDIYVDSATPIVDIPEFGDVAMEPPKLKFERKEKMDSLSFSSLIK